MTEKNKQIQPNLNWDDIDTVLLDMDGTLLDKHFDDQFWGHHVQQRYGEKNDLSFEEAYATLSPYFKKAAGTLEWTDMDYWSRTFGLDIFTLKHEISHLIQELPGTIEFLDYIRDLGKEVVLVTNCHPKGLALKFTMTSIENYFDRTTCATEMRASKEEAIFWERLQEKIGFDKRRSLFIDDNQKVLEVAQSFGLTQLVSIARPSSNEPLCYSGKFPSVASLAELTQPIK